MKIAELIGKKVLIVGLGLTGLSVARYLVREAIAFEVADENDNTQALAELDVTCVRHGEFTADVFCTFDVIVLSPGIPRAHTAIVAALDAGVDVIGDIELFADAVRVPVVAVTGSNGKSTVVAWLADALNETGMKAAVCGNIGEPALDSLLSDVDVLVLELSSYQLESTRSLKPFSAVVLNVSEDHLDRYDNIDHYASVKRHVFSKAQHCVANYDDNRTWPAQDSARTCSYFSTNDTADNTCQWQRTLLNGVNLALPGEHNVANALAVLALAEPLGVPHEVLVASLGHFKGLAHRSEYVGEHGGVRWYNDSKGTNVDACKKAVLSMPGPVILIAGGMSKDADFSALRETVKQHVKLLVLIGEDRQKIADCLSDCAEAVMADTLQQAVSLGQDRSKAGDVVLLSPACASFDMFRNFEDRGEQFVAAVQEVLAA